MAGCKGGGHSVARYTPNVVERICDEIMHGATLIEICKQPDMPSSASVYRWLQQHPDFREAYDLAREIQAEHMDHLIMQCAAETDSENYNAMRVKMSAYQWRASRLNPARYGDKQTNIHKGAIVIQSTKEDEKLT